MNRWSAVMNRKSPQALNEAFIANRTIPVLNIHSQGCVGVIQEALGKLPAIQKIDINVKRKQVRLVYDSTQIGFELIEKSLIQVGYPITDNWWTKLKIAWYCYMDDTDQSNSEFAGGACCGNPKNIYANRRK